MRERKKKKKKKKKVCAWGMPSMSDNKLVYPSGIALTKNGAI